jgi:hypothetical protein
MTILTVNNTARSSKTWYRLVGMYLVAAHEYDVRVWTPYDETMMPFATLDRNLKEITLQYCADTSAFSPEEIALFRNGLVVNNAALAVLDHEVVRETKQRQREAERARKQQELEERREARREQKEEARRQREAEKKFERDIDFPPHHILGKSFTSEEEDEEEEDDEQVPEDDEDDDDDLPPPPSVTNPRRGAKEPQMEMPKPKPKRKQTTLTQMQGGVTRPEEEETVDLSKVDAQLQQIFLDAIQLKKRPRSTTGSVASSSSAPRSVKPSAKRAGLPHPKRSALGEDEE